MSDKPTSPKKLKTPKNDDSLLSANHSKNVRYRLRLKETEEAEDEIERFLNDETKYKDEQGY